MNGDDYMDRIFFYDIAELGNFMHESAEDESLTVSSVMLYDKAVELIRWLMTYDDITVGSINIENEDYNGYKKEFYITLDSDLILDVTPAYKFKTEKSSAGYTDIDADLILYDGDANSRIAIQSECLNKFEIVFDEECEDSDYDDSTYSHYNFEIIEILKLLDYILNQ